MAATSEYYADAKPNTTPFSVEGKRAIITGAGSGAFLMILHWGFSLAAHCASSVSGSLRQS